MLGQENLYGKVVGHTRGKLLGGSSAINVLALIYPSKSGLDTWEKLGNKGWNYETMAPYYRKFHTYIPPTKQTGEDLEVDYIDDEAQGTSGPIQSSFPEFVGPLTKAWPATWKNMNYKVTGDPLRGNAMGGYTSPSTIDPKTMTRSHAGSAYYSPVAGRPNLHLITEAMVEKVVLEHGKNGGEAKATGVAYTKGEDAYTVFAKREVIMAAGVYQTPQLLELSGIGGKALLDKHGIECVVDNPYVGENLQDHPMTGVSLEVADGIPTTDMIRDPNVVNWAMNLYQTEKTGPLSASFNSASFMPVVDFLSAPGKDELDALLDKHLTPSNRADLPSQADQEAFIRSVLTSPDEGSVMTVLGSIQLHLEKTKPTEIFAVTDPANYACFLVALPHPFSRGHSHIASAKATDKPAIDPKYFSHPLDAEILARHVMYTTKIAATEPLKGLLKPGGKTLPEKLELDSVEGALEHCRRNLTTNNHPCGTCAMLPKEKGGVVDTELKVYGVAGLRVVDASVLPMVPLGNIQSSVYAVAERAADIIKAAYQ